MSSPAKVAATLLPKGPYVKLVFCVLAIYAVQALWTRYVSGTTYMTPGEFLTWWGNKILAVARWGNEQWKATRK